MAGSGTRSRENNSGAGGGVPVTLATCMSTHLENIAIGASYYKNHHQSQMDDCRGDGGRRAAAASVTKFGAAVESSSRVRLHHSQ